MATLAELGQKVKAKYPGSYDDIPDADLGRKIQAKFLGSYDDFSDEGSPVSGFVGPKFSPSEIAQRELPSPGIGAITAHVLGAPVTALAGIPGELKEYFSGHRQPSGGFLSEEPITQMYGNALTSLGGWEKGTTPLEARLQSLGAPRPGNVGPELTVNPSEPRSSSPSGSLPQIPSVVRGALKFLPKGNLLLKGYDLMQSLGEKPGKVVGPPPSGVPGPRMHGVEIPEVKVVGAPPVGPMRQMEPPPSGKIVPAPPVTGYKGAPVPEGIDPEAAARLMNSAPGTLTSPEAVAQTAKGGTPPPEPPAMRTMAELDQKAASVGKTTRQMLQEWVHDAYANAYGASKDLHSRTSAHFKSAYGVESMKDLTTEQLAQEFYALQHRATMPKPK